MSASNQSSVCFSTMLSSMSIRLPDNLTLVPTTFPSYASFRILPSIYHHLIQVNITILLPFLYTATTLVLSTIISLLIFNKARDFIGKGCLGREQQGKGTQENFSAMWLTVSGFMAVGLISGWSSANHCDSWSLLVANPSLS